MQVVHLHGLRFQVVSMTPQGEGPSQASAPLLRDTVPVPGNGSVTLRVIADNPGVWMLHAMAGNSRQRGAATALNVLPSRQPLVPPSVPTQGPCAATII